ncbi:MAG: hypothetical protein J6Y98_05715 [Bacteroidales bacterium]|nr:hypothetical protein [Bacteroidales bacterium]
MKKFFKLAAIAVCAMGLAVACNNADNTEKQDTPAMDTPATVDTPVVDTMDQDTIAPVEEPAPAKTAAKKGNKTAKDNKKAPTMTAATSNERNPNTTTSNERVQGKVNANSAATKGLSAANDTKRNSDAKTGAKVK